MRSYAVSGADIGWGTYRLEKELYDLQSKPTNNPTEVCTADSYRPMPSLRHVRYRASSCGQSASVYAGSVYVVTAVLFMLVVGLFVSASVPYKQTIEPFTETVVPIMQTRVPLMDAVRTWTRAILTRMTSPQVKRIIQLQALIRKRKQSGTVLGHMLHKYPTQLLRAVQYTDVAYAATRSTIAKSRSCSRSDMRLRACYAMSGTDIAYGVISLRAC
eukprot:1468634-Rhodomonas_salina.2